LLVIAGAGSGKTRTLTYRVAYLLENGIDPRNILLLTFTNKAARQMLDRVANLLPVDASGLWGGTFHSVGNRMLRRHGSALGYSSGFTMMDREDQKDLIDTVVAAFYAVAPLCAAINWKRAACRRRTITLLILLNSSWLSVRSSSRC
jgi:DNA helicase-2/ATP-dependent DNA helicase PcrA